MWTPTLPATDNNELMAIWCYFPPPSFDFSHIHTANYSLWTGYWSSSCHQDQPFPWPKIAPWDQTSLGYYSSCHCHVTHMANVQPSFPPPHISTSSHLPHDLRVRIHEAMAAVCQVWKVGHCRWIPSFRMISLRDYNWTGSKTNSYRCYTPIFFCCNAREAKVL